MMQLRFNLLGWETRVRFACWTLATLHAATSASFAGAPSESVRWLTGQAARRQTALATEVHWQESPLRDSLQRLARAHAIAIVLDRRIDPHQPLTFSLTGHDLIETLRRLAQPSGWDVSFLSSALYIGPAHSTRPLATWQSIQQAQAARLPEAVRRRWLRPARASWPELAEPRRLVDRWVREARVAVKGQQRIPHDLWPAQELPPMNLLDRLIIVLAGFELAPEIQPDGSLNIVPLPRDAVVSKTYRLTPHRRSQITALTAKMPNLQIRAHGSLLEIRGRVEDHRHLQDWLQGEARRNRRGRTTLADKRFSLTVKNQSVDSILQTLARQLDVQLVWEEGTESIGAKRVSLSVENVPVGQLIAVVLADQPATYRLQSGQLVISPTSAVDNASANGAR